MGALVSTQLYIGLTTVEPTRYTVADGLGSYHCPGLAKGLAELFIDSRASCKQAAQSGRLPHTNNASSVLRQAAVWHTTSPDSVRL